MPLRAKFRIPPTGVLALFEKESTSNGRIELDNALFAGDGKWFEYLTAISEPMINESSIAAHARVSHIESEPIESPSDIQSFLVLAEESELFTIKMLTSNEAIPHRIFLEDGLVTIVTSVQDWNHLKELAEELEKQYSTFKLLGTTQVDCIGYPLGNEQFQFRIHGKISEKQMRIFKIAYKMGFFEIPQEKNGKEIAEQLNISQSTMSEKLRRAQQNLCELLFGKRESDP